MNKQVSESISIYIQAAERSATEYAGHWLIACCHHCYQVLLAIFQMRSYITYLATASQMHSLHQQVDAVTAVFSIDGHVQTVFSY